MIVIEFGQWQHTDAAPCAKLVNILFNMLATDKLQAELKN